MSARFGTVEERFMANVQKTETCWVWMGYKHPSGYGQFSIKHKSIRAHRFSYIMKHGKIPDDMIICHKCDNPSCVNPDHLFAGTHTDNIIDSIKKGRRFNSDGSYHTAKLTTSEVLRIRELYAGGTFTKAELGRKFHVNKGNIGLIINGKAWIHI